MHRKDRLPVISLLVVVGLLLSFLQPFQAYARPSLTPFEDEVRTGDPPPDTGVPSTGAPPAQPEVLPPAEDQPAEDQPADPFSPDEVEEIQSLSGSLVVFDPSVGYNNTYIGGAEQTFCFRSDTYTADEEYVNRLWLKFPTSWNISSVFVHGTPTCTGGGYFAPFSWTFQTAPYEVNINHKRYQETTDHCTAYYCVTATPAYGASTARVSWFYDGDGFNGVPHNPCSNDLYTPTGQPACDQATAPRAAIPAYPYLLDLTNANPNGVSCNNAAQIKEFSLLNNTGSSTSFQLSYSVPSQNGQFTGPQEITVNQGERAFFNASLASAASTTTGEVVNGLLRLEGNGATSYAEVSSQVNIETHWEPVVGTTPDWGREGFPGDGCTASNASGQPVTYIIGDTNGTSLQGFWGFNHDTQTWFQPAAANTPADRWAPDWAYDPATNLCYLTGGASTPGTGTYKSAYVYNPVVNAFSTLASFTTPRDFHDSWIGTVDGVKRLCIGGGNYSDGGLTSTQCLNLVSGVWAAENTTIPAYPVSAWASADGTLNGNQFWFVAGVQNGSVTDAAWYFDDADNEWHSAGNTGAPGYRMEGDFYEGAYYQVGGSPSGFTPTTSVRIGLPNGSTTTWSEGPPLILARMDTVISIANGTIWVIDGYSSSIGAPSVEQLVSCRDCAFTFNPTELYSYQAPGRVSTRSFRIKNTGEIPLQWNLIEAMELSKTGGGAFNPVNVSGASSVEGFPVTLVSPASETPTFAPRSIPSTAVLWDQPLSTLNEDAYVSQDFPDSPTYSSFLFDDFTSANFWKIDSIFVPGGLWNLGTTLMNASSLTWQIYADNQGQPAGDPAGGGSPPIWTLTLLPTDPQVVLTAGSGELISNTQLNLEAPLYLAPGHYWLVFFPSMTFSAGGQYGRQPADTHNGYMTQFINPGGSFGYGTNWQNWTPINAVQQDLAFRLEGAIYDIPWLSETPTQGSLAPGASVTVSIRFDSHGLLLGEYPGLLQLRVGGSTTLPVNLKVGAVFLPFVRR